MSYSWEPYRMVHAEPARNPAAHLPHSILRPHGWARGGGGGPSAKRSGCGHGLLYHKSSDSLEHTLPASFSDDGGLNEKQLMQGLNDRFAGYIEKVRQLEQQNRGLETEIVELRRRRCSPSRLAAAFEPELRELRQLLQGMERHKVQVELERERLAGDMQLLQGRCEDEARLRAEMEAGARLFGKHAEDSQRCKLALEKKAQALTEEMLFLKSMHQEEVADLFAQLQASQPSVDLKELAKPDLTAALREIRAQMVGCTSHNLQETEEWFRCRVAALSEAAHMNNEALQNRRQEISEYRRQLQTKSVELETARGTKESLEKQVTELEERHDAELVHYQDVIQQLENELKNSKWEVSHHLREYQDLLNVKMALDVEIASYRKLLEGEETRFGSIGSSFTLPSYTYRQTQSLTHSVFASTKAKGTPTKAAPQYKFVEEIISETTKEVDMAELDDSVLRVISDSGSGEKLEEEESTRPEEDEDKDEATTAEASDEEEAERSSETKEESAEEEGIESKAERVESKESEKDMPTKESGIVKAETTKSEEEPSKGKDTEEYDTVEMKEDEKKGNAEIKRESEEEESTEKDSEKQEPTKAKDEDEQQNLKKREAIEEEKTAGSKLDGEVITDKVESKEQEIAEAKEENEVSAINKTEKQESMEEAQTEAGDAKGESIEEEGEQQEELKGTSQRKSAAEVADKNTDQKQVESIVQEPQRAKVEKESSPQELAKESENQKVETSEEAKMPEMSGQVGKPNDQVKEEKCEDKKPNISKNEGKEGNQGKKATKQEEKKESEEKSEQTSEAEKVGVKVAAGTPESKSTQSGERSPEALINGMDIKVVKEEMESETDKKTKKTSTQVIQKIAEKTIESKEGISKVSVTSTVKTAVTEEMAKEKISDPRSDSKESK